MVNTCTKIHSFLCFHIKPCTLQNLKLPQLWQIQQTTRWLKNTVCKITTELFNGWTNLGVLYFSFTRLLNSSKELKFQFQISALCFDTGFNMLPEVVQNGCDVFWSDFLPCSFQSMFKWFNGFTLERACFLLQDPPNSEVHWTEIRGNLMAKLASPRSRKGSPYTTPESSSLRGQEPSPAAATSQCFLHVFQPMEWQCPPRSNRSKPWHWVLLLSAQKWAWASKDQKFEPGPWCF